MKIYILATDKGTVLTKQDGNSDQVRVPRTYMTMAQAERFAAKFAASIFTVNAPARVGNGYKTWQAIEDDAKALGLRTHTFTY